MRAHLHREALNPPSFPVMSLLATGVLAVAVSGALVTLVVVIALRRKYLGAVIVGLLCLTAAFWGVAIKGDGPRT